MRERKNTYHYIPKLGERLQQVIYEQDINMEDMARKTGIGRNYIWDYVHEVRNPSAYSLMMICEYCNVSADYLLFGKNNEKENRIHNVEQQKERLLSEFISAYTDIDNQLQKIKKGAENE